MKWDLSWPWKDLWGFPDKSVGKESACKAGDPGSISGLGRSPGEETGYPLQYSRLENSLDCMYSPCGCKELYMTTTFTFTFWKDLHEQRSCKLCGAVILVNTSNSENSHLLSFAMNSFPQSLLIYRNITSLLCQTGSQRGVCVCVCVQDPDILIQWLPFVILSGTLPLGDWVILGKSKKECVINYKSPTDKVSRQESSCGLISTFFPVYLSFFLSLSVQISLSVHLVMLCTIMFYWGLTMF